MKEFTKDLMQVKIAESREEMGRTAALDVAARINKMLEQKDYLNIIFAAAPSQNEMLWALCECDIPWERINAFHMDEYIGLPKEAPQGFGNFLKAAIFGKKPFRSVNYIDGTASDIAAECERYTSLLSKYPPDICCMGIGENGHIAFNDPWVADFHDTEIIKPVKLDEVCRMQQVHDGCFKTLDDVPTSALTLTVPTLYSSTYIYCVVPAITKAKAVYGMIAEPISEALPATILRRHNCAVLYCDKESSSEL